MQNNKNAFSALQNIELWCNSIKNANTVTAKCAGMLALLMEVEYAIEKYRSMADRFKFQLPLNVTVHDFEEWTGKIDTLRSTCILSDIEDYCGDYFVNLTDGDQDIRDVFAVRMSDEDLFKQPLPMLVLDEELAMNIDCFKNLEYLTMSMIEEDLKEKRIKIADARSKILKLKLGLVINDKFCVLSSIIDTIIELLTAPTEDAIYDVYENYSIPFLMDGGERYCERQIMKWVADYGDKTNIIELLDEKIASLRKDIMETFYGDKWDTLFEETEYGFQTDNSAIGRYIYRNLGLFKDNPDNINRFFTHLNLWEYFNDYKDREIARVEDAEQTIAKDENNQEIVQDILLPEIFKDSLRNNPARTELLLNIIRKDIIPRVTERKGAKDKKWRWPHVYYAFKDPRLDFIAADTAKIAFGRAMHDIENSLVANNIAQTFKDLNPKFPLVPDQAIITDMVNLFKAV